MYTTAFDKSYLTRGIAMIESLFHQDHNVSVSVLCLDLETEIAVSSLSRSLNVHILRPQDMGESLLLEVRQDREYREFCWALGALLCNFHLESGESEVVYLDADIYFFGNPKILLNEARQGDVAAIKHRFPSRLRHYEVNGLFNVQWIYFANTHIGRQASKKWAEQCFENSSYQPELGIVGDQKYLDEWPLLYSTFIEIMNPGAGVAPWNHEVHMPHLSSDRWLVDESEELIFYHFHGLRINTDGAIELSGPVYSEVVQLPVELYNSYLEALADVGGRFPLLVTGALPSSWHIIKNDKIVGKIVKKLKGILS
jgi:hypothetical protein